MVLSQHRGKQNQPLIGINLAFGVSFQLWPDCPYPYFVSAALSLRQAFFYSSNLGVLVHVFSTGACGVPGFSLAAAG